MKSKNIVLIAGLVISLGLLTLYIANNNSTPSAIVQQPNNEIISNHIAADDQKSSDDYTVIIKKAQTRAVWYDDAGALHEDVMLA
jgi:hypothetical protein